MKLGLQQSLRTDLQLRLSPQMLQRIEVLQLPAIDLAQMIENELQDNEVLEVAEDPESAPSDEQEAEAETSTEDDRLMELLDHEDDWRPARPDEDAVSRTDLLEALTAAPVTLQDDLHRQLDLLELGPRERVLADAIVDALNERGWLDGPLDEVRFEVSPPATAEEREHALHVVQSLDPPGIGCRDLVECLLLQLDEVDEDYQLLATLILNHLDDIARNRIPRIAKETGEPVERVLEAIDAISHLDPVPGRRFGGPDVPFVRPDLFVTRVGDDFEISLENDWLPELAVSRRYLALARDRSTDPQLRRHLRGKIEAARAFIDAVSQRKHTLFRVASELVARQPGFVEHGKSHLRPLRMQDVADALGVHVSTVSRAIAGKSMQTPRGIVPLRDFFTGEVPAREGGGGEGASRASVQELVRSTIAAEDSRHPLSDEAIVRVLAEEHGLEIARRTVTKYRKALGLGSSRDRRTYGDS